LTHGGSIRDYYGEFKVPGPLRPLISIPTTAGTGSEVSPVAVLSDPDSAMKVGIASPYLISHTAICDPELTYSCPSELTLISGCDALTHAIEAFTAIERPATALLSQERVFVGKNILSDQYALQAIELISRSLMRAKANDESARNDLMLGALCAGMAFGTAGTAAAHAIQYPVGALTHTAHGTGVALLLPYVMDFNRKARVREFGQIATAMGANTAGLTEEAMSRLAIEVVGGLFAQAGIPKTLAEIGVQAEQLELIAQQSFSAQRLVNNNPVSLAVEALLAIATAAYCGALTTGIA
jgi:alcohol dehydrogenase class IV